VENPARDLVGIAGTPKSLTAPETLALNIWRRGISCCIWRLEIEMGYGQIIGGKQKAITPFKNSWADEMLRRVARAGHSSAARLNQSGARDCFGDLKQPSNSDRSNV